VAVAEAPQAPLAHASVDEDDLALAVDGKGEDARLLHVVRRSAGGKEGRPGLARHLGQELRGREAKVGVAGGSNLNVTDADLLGHDGGPSPATDVGQRTLIQSEQGTL
jgi:hypothetical protein